ncbi:transcription termination factor MTERF5, chloroplastic-like isoform X1 [Mangifera indica]|uniref:transcription termination factor MTERF5, chloroplastic-like isoform X1 n=2 Tax=Mangifera indica TaxID=29780 RepID=UPI001CFBCCBB|nr:transcription termination factor MTERF5, chloroplastic-like isoform X1 [Mangifera indica]
MLWFRFLKMAMKTLSGTCSSDLLSLFRGVFCIIRPRLASPGKVFFCCRISSSTDAPVHELFNLSVVPPTLLASERKEAKSVLTLFLMQQGLSKAVAARTITKSNHFIEHLVSRLYSAHKSGYLVGRELTTPEIRDTLNPYLQSLVEEHGNFMVDFVKNFPSAPIQKKPALPVCRSHSSLYSKKPEAVSFVSAPSPAADLCPQFLYLLELGMDLEKIKLLTRRYPNFSYYSLEGKIKPLVEFLLDLGVPKSCIPTILSRRPSLCGHSLSKKIIPSMIYLEDLGVDKKQWAKVICRSPDLLCHSRQKVQAIVNFLHESGLSGDSIGNILTKFPAIVGYSLEDNLRPTAKYFKQLGVNAAIILCRSPVTFGHSIEGHLKPVTNFFLEREFSVEEVGTMVSRYTGLYTLSLTENLIPKWEFFPTMGYSRPELVKFPQYFSYSLEQRIKPRFALVKGLGMKMVLSSMLAPSQCNFEKVLIRNRKNLLADKGSSHTEDK